MRRRIVYPISGSTAKTSARGMISRIGGIIALATSRCALSSIGTSIGPPPLGPRPFRPSSPIHPLAHSGPSSRIVAPS